jgi:F-type H+-transporting ATPase subunit b
MKRVIVLDFGIALASVPDGRLFGLDLQTFLQICANLINVSILAYVLSRLLYKPVREFMQRRAERINGELEQAGYEMAKATDLRYKYEQKMKDVERERDAIIDEARKVATETSRQIIADAKKEADAIRDRAAVNVDMEWERAQSAMRTAIIDVSAAMAEKFVTLAINKETHDKLFGEAMWTWRGCHGEIKRSLCFRTVRTCPGAWRGRRVPQSSHACP